VNAILLAAGYGTRLYPLTRDRPKPLLPVGGRPILEYLVERLESAPEIEAMFLVTNARFVGHFQSWAAGRRFCKPMRILNDGTTSNETRLGAIADVQFACDFAGIGGQAAYVLGTDNLPRFDLLEIIDLSQRKKASAVFGCPASDLSELRRSGVASVDEEGRIVAFEEKPKHPRGNLRIPPFYAYTPAAMEAIGEYLDGGGNPDAPGHFLQWLVTRQPVYALVRKEGTWDIGTPESYRAVCAQFERQRLA